MTKKEKLQRLAENGIVLQANATTAEINESYATIENLFERETEKIEPAKVEPVKVEPVKVEPEKVEPEEDEDGFKKLAEDLGKKVEINGGDTPPEYFATDGEGKPLIEKTRKKKTKRESSPDSFRIEGFILLIAVDVIFPTAIKFLNDKILKKQGVPLDNLRMTDEQMKKIEPLANQAADYMQVHINPITGFFIASGFVYTNNYVNSGYLYTEKSR